MSWLKGLVMHVMTFLGISKVEPRFELQSKVKGIEVPQFVVQKCMHRPAKGVIEVPLRGWRVFVQPTLCCSDCIGEWLDEVSGTCEGCGALILPDDEVISTSDGYVHFRFGCYAGETNVPKWIWGSGTPVSLH